MTFVTLDAAQAVLFGSFLQRLDSFLVGLLVFGISSILCLAAVVWRSPHEIGIALREPRAVTWMALHAAGGWLTYLGALQLIEPAVAMTIVSGVLPLTMIAAAYWGVEAAEPVHSAIEVGGNLLLGLGVAALSAFTLLGWSGFVRGGLAVGLIGLALAVVSAMMFAGMILTSYQLGRKGIGPSALFVLRFPLYLVLALGGFLLGLDEKAPAPTADLLAAFLAGIPLLALPIYAIQKAVSLASSLTVGTAVALTPVLVFVMQMIEGRVDFAPATVVGLSIYSAGAIAAAFGRAQGVARQGVPAPFSAGNA